MRFYSFLMSVVALLVIAGCGGGSGGITSGLTKVQAVAKIVAYANSDGSTAAPTVVDYSTAEVDGVDTTNIDKVNVYLALLSGDDAIGDLEDAIDNPNKLEDDDNDGLPNGKDTVPKNARPVANSQSVSLNRDKNKSITLVANDAEGDPLTYRLTTNTSHGRLDGTAPNFIYVPDTGYSGADSFAFVVNDTHTDSLVATVSIAIIGKLDDIDGDYFVKSLGKGLDSTIKVPLKGDPKDVYILLTNHSDTAKDESASIKHNAKIVAKSAKIAPNIATDTTRATRSAEYVREFNRNSKSLMIVNRDKTPMYKVATPSKLMQKAVGDTRAFNMGSEKGSSTDATLKKVVSNISTANGDKTLNIWVSDDSFGAGCSLAKCVTQEMVDALADEFLKVGSDNDIYDWVTNIYGEEWGDDVQSIRTPTS